MKLPTNTCSSTICVDTNGLGEGRRSRGGCRQESRSTIKPRKRTLPARSFLPPNPPKGPKGRVISKIHSLGETELSLETASQIAGNLMRLGQQVVADFRHASCPQNKRFVFCCHSRRKMPRNRLQAGLDNSVFNIVYGISDSERFRQITESNCGRNSKP